MRFLVLGSAGLIGAYLCQYLRDLGHDVDTFDFVDDRKQDLRIYNNQLLIEHVKNCDFVFFLAWDVGGAKYLGHQQAQFSFMHNNLAIMHNVFDILARTNKPFLFTSTQMSSVPTSTYGLTKLLGEKLSKSLNSIVVKLWNVYGYEPVCEKSHVIADFIYQALTTKQINMLTDGKEQRQFLHARDCAECLYILSQRYAALPRDMEYHVTGFEWSTILEIAHYVSDAVPGTEVVPGTNKDLIQPGNRIQPNDSILHYWKPTTDLRSGIEKLIEHYK